MAILRYTANLLQYIQPITMINCFSLLTIKVITCQCKIFFNHYCTYLIFVVIFKLCYTVSMIVGFFQIDILY